MNKKYPIGTKIRFLYTQADTVKIGTLVALTSNGRPIISLPNASRKESFTLKDGTPYSWKCMWHEIEPVKPKVGQQLVFSFMEEG